MNLYLLVTHDHPIFLPIEAEDHLTNDHKANRQEIYHKTVICNHWDRKYL